MSFASDLNTYEDVPISALSVSCGSKAALSWALAVPDSAKFALPGGVCEVASET